MILLKLDFIKELWIPFGQLKTLKCRLKLIKTCLSWSNVVQIYLKKSSLNKNFIVVKSIATMQQCLVNFSKFQKSI
jgi:hypothetical protein